MFLYDAVTSFAELDHPITKLTLSADGDESFAPLLPFFRRTTRLSTLNIDTHSPSIFEALPHPLSNLTIIVTYAFELHSGWALDLLKHDFPSLSKLGRLEIKATGKFARIEELDALCLARGIDLSVVEEAVSSFLPCSRLHSELG